MSIEYVKYPNRLRECIKASGYKIKIFAQEINIPLRTVFHYCKGEIPIPIDRLEEIANLLGYSPEYLVPPPPNKPTAGQVTTSLWHVPHQRNPFFTGREALLAHLHETLSWGKATALTHPQAISGLGGIGKTQLALEYAYRYHQEYEAVFWVKADTRESVLTDFIGLAHLLNLPEQHAEDLMVAASAVLAWLTTHMKWLLIFDNIDDLAMLPPFLPPALGGHILLTTRAQATGGLAQRIDVECMTSEVGALFLLRRASILAPDATLEQTSTQDRALAFQIVEELGGLPLALDQAGAYIEESAYHLAGYFKLYHKQRTALLKRRGGLATDHPAPVATTWSLSFERVEQADSLAADLLRLCAFLDPDAIPEEILLEGIRASDSQSEGTLWDQWRANEAVGILLRFSLVQGYAETVMLTMHRLVQAVIQDMMDKETQRLWAERTRYAVKQAFPQSSQVYSATGYPYRAVQLLKASMYVDQECDDKAKRASALWNLAVQQLTLGRLCASEQSLRDSIALCREVNDPFNQAKAHQYFALQKAYQGIFKEAFRHLDVAWLLFQEAGASASEGVVWAYRSLCYLLADDIQSGLAAAKNARMLVDEQNEERDVIRSEWLLGWASVRLAVQRGEQAVKLLGEAELHLKDALDRCRRVNMVDYEADLLLAWARLHHAKGDNHQAKVAATEALAITNHSAYRMLRSDIYNFLAQLNLEGGNWLQANEYAQAALADATCDGFPYSYLPTLEQAKSLLDQIGKHKSMEISRS